MRTKTLQADNQLHQLAKIVQQDINSSNKGFFNKFCKFNFTTSVEEDAILSSSMEENGYN
jgi:hypothetical protein